MGFRSKLHPDNTQKSAHSNKRKVQQRAFHQIYFPAPSVIFTRGNWKANMVRPDFECNLPEYRVRKSPWTPPHLVV
jgi:hypothetical protein